MKKRLLIFIFIFINLLIGKYFLSDYLLQYNINKHSVKTDYSSGRFYFEIDNKYNFEIYKNRGIKKTIIKKIIDIKEGSLNCVYPVIDDIDTYPICYYDGEIIDYNLIDNELLNKYKITNNPIEKNDSNFIYNNNIDNKTYIALWNYKGYIIMNGKSYKIIDLFEKDRYDNSLSFMINNIIYMPNYNQEHEFKNLIALDVTTYSKKTLELGYTLDYDSYIVGNIGKYLYIYDNKYSILYEINIKNGKTTIKSNNEIGYVKYEDGGFISCSKSEYKVNKIKYNNDNSIYSYKYNNGLFKSIKDNDSLPIKINNNDIFIIKTYKNILYYVDEDYLYKYDPLNGSNQILYFFELNFNKENTIFIYNK